MDPLSKILTLAQLIEYGVKVMTWGINRFRWRKISKELREIAFAFNSYSWHYLHQSTPAIRSIGTIDRPEIRQILEIWDSSDEPILLRGEGGTGKSGIAVGVAQILANEGTPVLLIRAVDLPKTLDPVSVIQQRLAYGGTLTNAFSKLAKERTVALIVDQLDSVSGTELCKGLVSFLNTSMGIPNIKILAVARIFEVEHDPDIANLDFRTIDSGSLSPDQARSLLSTLGLHKPSDNIVKLARNLLQLSLIADVASSQKSSLQGVEQQVDLWEKYFLTIEQREGQDAAELALDLAHKNTIIGLYSFPAPFPLKKPWRVLLSRGILIEVMGRRFAFKHEQMQEFLCAYSIFPDQPTVNQLVNEFGTSLPRNVISWLHLLYHKYSPDSEHLYIESLLKSKNDLAFYSRVIILDNLRNQISPTFAIAKTLSNFLIDPPYGKYFFENLENPAWVIPLYESSLFTKLPPPYEDPNNAGYFSMPVWYAGEYLKRMAEKFPDVVKNVALSLATDNSRAIRTMLEALVKIPADITAETVDQFQGWMETPFSNFMILSHELGIVMEYLAKEGQVAVALAVLNILLEPIQVKDRFEAGKLMAGTRHDYYWLNETLQNNLPTLTKIDPIGVASVAEVQLMKAIELEHDPRIDESSKKLNSYWRLSISPRSEANHENEIKNVLVDTIITAFDYACEQNVTQINEIVTRFIESDYSIFRRIANFILRTWGHQYKDLLEKTYKKNRQDPIKSVRSEFDRLVEIQLRNLPEFAQKEVVNERLTPDSELVEDLLENYPERFSGQTLEEKRQTIIERWQLEDLTPIARYLEKEDKDYYESLLSKHGPPSPRIDEEEPATVSWIGSKSPIELEEITKKSVIQVVQFLLEYVPSSNAPFDEPSRGGLANVLENDVKARVHEYADQAILFVNEDLRFVYHTHFLRGLENAAKNQERFNLKYVIDVCEFIANQKEDRFQRQEFEEGLQAAKLAVVHLFEELFRSREPYIEIDLLELSGQLIVKMLHQEEPFPDDEQAQGYDPATHSLNCVHGVAMHSLVSYGLYCERKRKKEMGDKGEPVMIPLMKAVLTEKLDKTKNPSLAVHSVLGWYFPQFIYLGREWALDNRDKIFPTKTEMTKYWLAAWSAYIRFSDVYTNVFPELIEQYQRALQDLTTLKEKQGIDRTYEKMATHILKAYLLNMIQLDSEDGLIHLYYQKADDETRSHGNFWLSQVLETQRPAADHVVWQKIWNLWRWRVKEATTSEDRNNYVKEISNFSRLLKNVPLGLSEIHPIIEQALEFKIHGFEALEIIKYLGKQCTKYPDLAISILYQIVWSDQQLYLLEETKKDTKQIISLAMKADDISRARAKEIINIFGERGDYSWKYLLDDFKE